MVRLGGILVGLGFVAALLLALGTTLWTMANTPAEPAINTTAYWHEHPREVNLPSDGPLGRFDIAQVQRGSQVFREVCAACHSLNLVHFRDFADLGYNEDEVKALAAGWPIQTPTVDANTGEPATRAPIPADRVPSPYANEVAARAANNNAIPPDLSLMVKARADGANYIYSLLTGYEDVPAELPEALRPGTGLHYNPYFHSLNLAMVRPLSTDGQITYTDGTEATVDQMARDVTAFLVWTAEPELNQRHRSGLVVLGFLLIFTILAFMSYRAIWPTKRAIEASTERRPAMHDAASVLTKRLAAIDAAIRIIPDFPQPGIQFRDITPLIADPPRFADAVEMMTERARALAADAIVAVEARGFLFGAPLALALGLPLVPVRKPGKLPGETHMIAYGLEYGADRLELHVDALGAGHRAVIIDDLLATGGTVAAAADLVRRTGAAVAGAVFLVELADLDGARVLTRPVPDRSKRC